MKRSPIVAAGLLLSLGLACSTSSDGDCSLRLCDAADGGGGGDAQADVVAPPGCDLTQDPKDSPACVDDGVGVFVDAAKGADTNPGTRSAPLKTVSKAVEAAGNKRVYVCEGVYAETLTVKVKASVYGGFTCADWKPGVAPVQIAPSQEGYALDIQKVGGGVVLVDLAFEAKPGTEAAPNSIAARVDTSSNVTLRRVSLTAKDGAQGKAGDGGTTGIVSNLAAIGGTINGSKAEPSTTPGPAKTCMCAVGGNTSGGGGGAPTGGGAGGTPALGGTTPVDGLGGLGAANCNAAEPNGAGNTGADAASATAAPKLGSTALGSLTDGAWVAQSGGSGTSGMAGQGGGGGGGRDGASAGGGGGCGGCGGSGGKGGAGGGASIALLSIGSTVSLSVCKVQVGTGGTGGTGGGGGFGGQGGLGGCAGGEGGKGGDGGAGGGGAGGVSVGIAYQGTKPEGQVSFTPGSPGEGGKGGIAGTNDGPKGAGGESYAIP